jgi:hypothetical protein
VPANGWHCDQERRSIVTTGDAAYWQARAEALERERDRLTATAKKWHYRALDEMAVIRATRHLLQGESPELNQRFQAILNQMLYPSNLFDFVEAAIAVARLNIDQDDSIRPQTNGATKAYHRLETALLVAELAEIEETERLLRARTTVWKQTSQSIQSAAWEMRRHCSGCPECQADHSCQEYIALRAKHRRAALQEGDTEIIAAYDLEDRELMEEMIRLNVALVGEEPSK